MKQTPLHAAFGCLAPLAAALAASFVACSDGAAESWTPVDLEGLTEEQGAQRERALAAQRDFAGALMGALGSALEEGGPAHAIGVCRDEAGAIAARAAREHGLRIGRTSHRLRNPGNAPPEWAAPLVEERVEDPRWLASADGRLAGLRPIRVAPLCLSCHGPREELDADVRQRLDEAYPEDRATGFSEGDLRGWFWIEVPPAAGN